MPARFSFPGGATGEIRASMWSSDVLRIRVSVLEATPSRVKPDRGTVRTLVEVLNQDGTVVMSMKPMNIIARRSST